MIEDQKPAVNKGTKIVLINLLILAAYTIYFRVTYGSHYTEEYVFIVDAFCIGVQVLLCLVVAIFTRPRDFLLSAGLVLVIGFATCTIGVS